MIPFSFSFPAIPTKAEVLAENRRKREEAKLNPKPVRQGERVIPGVREKQKIDADAFLEQLGKDTPTDLPF